MLNLKLFTDKGVPLLAAWDVSLEMLFIVPAWEQVIGNHPEKSIVTGPLVKEIEEGFSQAGHMGWIDQKTGRIMSINDRYGVKAYDQYYGEKKAVMAAFGPDRCLYIGIVGTSIYDAAITTGIYREEIAKGFHKRGLLGTLNGSILTLPLPWETEAEKEDIKPLVNAAVGMCANKLVGAWDNGLLWVGEEGALVEEGIYLCQEAGLYYDGYVKGETAKQLSDSGLFDIGVIVEGRLRRA